MDVGLNTLYNIGSNYTIKLNEKEVLVVEDDETRVQKVSDSEKLEKEIEKEKELKESKNSSKPEELSTEEEELVKNLQARDAEVKAHEAAHQAAGGGMTGGASFSYQQGPDGKMYAIGGEVSISIPSGSTPQETISNARQAVAAAMAPGNPSGQDHAVAASARAMEIKAQQQLARERQEETTGLDTYANQTNSEDEKDSQSSLDISA